MAQTSAVSRSSPTADFPIIKAGLGEFQPGVIARRRSDLKPTVSDLLSGETTGRDDLIDPQYFDQLRGHEVFDYSWDGWEHPVSLFPMIYSDVSMVAAAYTLPIGQAQTLLPATARLTPMRLTPWRAVILFFAFDYRRGGLGTYREFGAAIPVLLDAPRALPLIPALRDAWRPNSDPRLGMFAVELPVDQERACVAGIKLYGLPKLVGRSEFEMDGAGGRVSMDHEGQRMASLRVRLKRPAPRKQLDLSFTTFSIAQGRIIRTPYATLGVGYRGRAGEAEVKIGEHPRFAKFKGLDLSRKPLEVRLIPRLNWIIWGPQDAGPT